MNVDSCEVFSGDHDAAINAGITEGSPSFLQWSVDVTQDLYSGQYIRAHSGLAEVWVLSRYGGSDRTRNLLLQCEKRESTHAHDRVSDDGRWKINLSEAVKIRRRCTTVHKREDDAQDYDYR